MESGAVDLIKGIRDGLRPLPRIDVDEWSAKNINLPESSAEPGPYRPHRTPYMIKIMKMMSTHSGVRYIVFMKCSQVGGTQIGLNWLGYIIDVAPGGTLVISPTDGNAKRNSKVRVEPMIKSSPVLRARIKSAKIREGGNTVLQKDFPGGFAIFTGSNSTADIKSLPCQYVMLDEADEYPEDLDGQGSVIELAKARTRTFNRSKVYINSTPTLEDTSIIAKEFEDTDQQYYFVPCPHCSALQKLDFENLDYTTGKYDEVYYKCVHCHTHIDERHKTWMLENGDWQVTCPEKIDPEKMGFHINALYSPWYSWARIAKDYDKAVNNEPRMRAFNNTILGKTHKQTGERPDYNIVYNKRVDFYLPNRPPNEVCFITAGADVQKDRIEIEIVGWAKGKRSYSLDYRILPGDTSQLPVWNELAKIVHQSWTRPDGIILPLRLLCVDSGHNQSMVYDFCRRFDATKVIPVKGGSNEQSLIFSSPKLVDYTKDGKKVGQVRSWNLGVSMLKSELYGWLRLNQDDNGDYPPGYCFFPREGHYSGVDYFKGLCSEQLETKNEKGTIKYKWVKKYHFNEPLDCRNYARAAASMLQIDRFEDAHYDAMVGKVVKKPVKKIIPNDEKEWL